MQHMVAEVDLDGNGFTMACLAVWIRNVALRSEVFRKREAVRSGGCDAIQWLQSTLSGSA